MVSGVPACSSFRVEGGELKPAGGVPVSDRGFRYGQHFFETIAVKGGRWGFYQEHLQILQRSGGAAGFVVREEDWAVVEKAPEHPLFRGNPQEGVVRLFWTAGDGGPADPPGIGRIYFTVEHGEVGSVGGKLKLGV
ncbi:MAG: hypothetical protein NZL93_05710, partial [Chthoniobacterales bacterium]|nr:hypothetical protein [Chthoniobacterales bacterium]